MPEYTVFYEKNFTERTETEIIFAPSVSDAWTMARQELPKSAKILDIVRISDNSVKYNE
jgi:hypothetical protein